MAKTKTKSPSQSESKKLRKAAAAQKAQTPQHTPEELYALSIASLEQSDFDTALTHAQALLSLVDHDLIAATSISDATPKILALPALNLLGEISVELGDVSNARRYFLLAVKVDAEGLIPEEQGGGAEKFLWLAQLSEEGGQDSVQWFEKGVAVLKRQIAELEATPAAGGDAEERDVILEGKRAQIASALSSVVEVYMTDLSWEEDAETRCESLITEAIAFAPENPEVLQTLASVRLSQIQFEDARSALERSMALWTDLDPDDDGVPDYPTRVSLARLLMEAEMEDEAMIVLERLSLEDDQSVEACYLGGWCLYLLGEKQKGSEIADEIKEVEKLRRASRRWLRNTLRLYEMQSYEDDRLQVHIKELVSSLDGILGPETEDVEPEEEWIDDEDVEDDDEEMAGT